MRPTAAFPQTLAEVAPAWLTETLRTSATLRMAAVVAVEAEPLGEVGAFAGLLARLRLRYDRPEAGAPASLVAKLPTSDPFMRERARALGVYEREVRFYQELASDAGMPAPYPYLAVLDRDTGHFLLLLEDLRDGRFGDQLAGCTFAEALVVVTALARFHAAWWNSPRLSDLDWLMPATTPASPTLRARFGQYWPRFVDRFGELLSPELRDVGETLGPRLARLLDDAPHGNETLIHGDCHLNNLFFQDPAADRPVVAVDWQLIRRDTSGAGDLMNFLVSSLPPAQRRAQEHQLLTHYYQVVRDHGVGNYTWDQFIWDCRMAPLMPFAIRVPVFPGVDASQPGLAQVMHVFVERFVAAIGDHDSLGLLPASG